jgi:phospholipid/cholesterol/gamma-HCH transport system substrate-binding protein
MFTRFVRNQLIILTVISVLAIGAVVFVYAQVPKLMGFGQQYVTARFAEGANLYENAGVTYRGYTIGKVTDLEFPPAGQKGIDVTMRMDDDLDIPADAIASIHSVSAIGEQYVDFEPKPTDRPGGPVLADGAVLPLTQTTVPQQIAPVLDHLQDLLNSVPTKSLQTTIREAGIGLDGAGPELRQIVDNVSNLVATADANYGPTQQLINDAGPVLQSQLDTAPAIHDWTHNLALVSDVLRQRDSELRGILDNVPPAAEALDKTVKGLKPTLPVLLSNLTSVGSVLAQYNAALEQVLVVYPKIIAAEQSGAQDPETYHTALGLDLRVQVENPPSCFQGYAAPGAQYGPRDPNDLTEAPTKPNSFCSVPQNDPRVVRGARNLPCQPAGTPRAPSPEECRNGIKPESIGVGIPDPNPTGNVPNPNPAGAATTPQSDGTPNDITPDDPLFVIGGIGDSAGQGKDATWQRFLLAPLAH